MTEMTDEANEAKQQKALNEAARKKYLDTCPAFGRDPKTGEPGFEPSTEQCQYCEEVDPVVHEACKAECEAPWRGAAPEVPDTPSGGEDEQIEKEKVMTEAEKPKAGTPAESQSEQVQEVKTKPKKAKPKTFTILDAAEVVLRKQNKAMSPKEIMERILADTTWTSRGGKNPQGYLALRLRDSVKKGGKFEKIDKSKYNLK